MPQSKEFGFSSSIDESTRLSILTNILIACPLPKSSSNSLKCFELPKGDKELGIEQ